MNKRAKKQKAIIFVIVLILALIFVYPLFLIVMNSVTNKRTYKYQVMQ